MIPESFWMCHFSILRSGELDTQNPWNNDFPQSVRTVQKQPTSQSDDRVLNGEWVQGFLIQLLLLMVKILHQLIGSFSHYFYGVIHPRWCRISAINNHKCVISSDPPFTEDELFVLGGSCSTEAICVFSVFFQYNTELPMQTIRSIQSEFIFMQMTIIESSTQTHGCSLKIPKWSHKSSGKKNTVGGWK